MLWLAAGIICDPKAWGGGMGSCLPRAYLNTVKRVHKALACQWSNGKRLEKDSKERLAIPSFVNITEFCESLRLQI